MQPTTRTVLGGWALLPVAGGLFWASLATPELVVTDGMRELLRPGITLSEAEAVIGRPPGVYTDRPPPGLTKAGERTHRWHTDAGTLQLGFDADGRLARQAFFPQPAEPLWDRLRRRLHV
jgi:hypothetical protein